MTIAAFAPHLAGRMLPPILTAREPVAMTYWMHASGCTAGLFRARRFEPAFRDVVRHAPAQLNLFSKVAA